MGDAKRGRFAGIAATNGTSTYQSEAKADAAQYGYSNGSNGVTVTVLKNEACPDPTAETNCYIVTVAMANAPQFFSQVVGLPESPSSAALVSGTLIHKYRLPSLAGNATPGILWHSAAEL